MKTRDVITGFIILTVLIAGVLWFRNLKNRKTVSIPTPTPISIIEKKVTQKFGGLKIPANADIQPYASNNQPALPLTKIIPGRKI